MKTKVERTSAKSGKPKTERSKGRNSKSKPKGLGCSTTMVELILERMGSMVSPLYTLEQHLMACAPPVAHYRGRVLLPKLDA